LGNLRARFWVETVLAATTLTFLILTLIWKDWIEVTFGIDPDHRSGSAEWAIVLGCAAATLICGSLATTEVFRARMHASASG
jgi:hypothetical protein